MINEPSHDGKVVNGADVHMETEPFQDADTGQAHLCTDWEIWRVAPLERVWITFLYVAELYGTIKVVHGDLSVSVYATDLLNYDPTGNFPGSGEQGLTGIVVHPSGDVFASMLYDSGGQHYPLVIRLHSSDEGLTASSRTTILDLVGEPQGQSHQISNLTLGPDEKLYVHVGDGFSTASALDLSSFRGKILRVEQDGRPATDNPFFDAADGLTARDYVFAYGFRNPFGGVWNLAEAEHYSVENGPAVDRFARIERGLSYGFDGSNESMRTHALYNWPDTRAPVNVAFVEHGLFHGSTFPDDKLGHAFVTESGPTYAAGPQSKRISEFAFDGAGQLTGEPVTFVAYNGTGKSSVAALAAGPDGLYFSALYPEDAALLPTDPGAKIYRVHHTGRPVVEPGPFTAEYFADRTLTGLRMTERVPFVDFAWGEGSPGPGLPVDYYEKGGDAEARLLWSSPSEPRAPLPTAPGAPEQE